MQVSNKTYNVVKYITIYILPLLIILSTYAGIYLNELAFFGVGVVALTPFLNKLLGIFRKAYYAIEDRNITADEVNQISEEELGVKVFPPQARTGNAGETISEITEADLKEK